MFVMSQTCGAEVESGEGEVLYLVLYITVVHVLWVQKANMLSNGALSPANSSTSSHFKSKPVKCNSVLLLTA